MDRVSGNGVEGFTQSEVEGVTAGEARTAAGIWEGKEKYEGTAFDSLPATITEVECGKVHAGDYALEGKR